VELDHIGGHYLARNDVVGENLGQLGNVAEQALNRASRELGKSLVGRGEDGEGASTLERVDQASSLNGSHQGLERTSRYSGIYNISHGRDLLICENCFCYSVFAPANLEQ